MKYYILDNNSILKHNTIYNIILGGRANGKSTGVLKFFIDEYFKNDCKVQFGLIRRYKIDNFYLQNYISQYLITYCIERYNCIIEYQGSKFIVKSVDNQKVLGIIGYVFCLSDINNIKSTQYDYVNYILFDEFIPMTWGEMINGNNEPTLLIHILSTVFRHRSDVKVFLVANTITKNNCYFDYFKIDLNIINTEIGSYKLSDYVSIEFVQSAYENEDEVPAYLKCIDDKAFTTGEFKTPYNIISSDHINSEKSILIGSCKAKERTYYIYIISTYDDFFYYFSCNLLTKNIFESVEVITYDDIIDYLNTNTTNHNESEMKKAVRKLRDTLDNNIINPLTFMYSYTTTTKVYCREYSLSKLSKNRVYIFNKLDIKKECFYSDGIILSQIEDIKNTKRY